MPAAKHKAKILSTGAVQRIINEEMPGYRVVELEPESAADLHDQVAQKSSRTLPSLVKLRQVSRGASAESAADEPVSEEALWGNSSQFALIEPVGPATSRDTMARRRRTVIVSHGKIITEQG